MDFGGDLSILEPSVAFQVMSFSLLTGEIKFVTHDNVASFYFRKGEGGVGRRAEGGQQTWSW